MKWAGKKVLVTGAGGFIGSHLTECLVKTGAFVTAFVRYNSRGDLGLLQHLPKEIVSNLTLVAGDLKDPCAVENAVKGQAVVFHLAALGGIPYSYVHPIDYVQTNIVGTSYLLNACLNENIEKFIHTSTSEVYGTARFVPISEDHPLQGQSPYSASKIAADKMAESFYRTFKLPVATIRPFNTYGPRQTARAVIPTIITQALKHNHIELGALSPTRDLTFVGDTVDGFMKMAESLHATGQVINIGASKEISIGELAELIFNLLGKKVNISSHSERKRPPDSEVERLMANTEKARDLLGWTAQTTLTDGLKNTIEWIQKNMSYYRTDSYHV
ncbi:MAG: NAD-dependent epimerase/dehydratase family protein [Desulfobacteraceae bacterium]|nr:NAD-dependent epimerase/dehydratase family protein [Desulfobacteraceae bacterium]